MHLGVARLCLDCQEVHDQDRCPACTSESFAFITRWIKLEGPPEAQPRTDRQKPSAEAKVDTYRQILHPSQRRTRAGTWLRNGGLLIAVGYCARSMWQRGSREKQSTSGD